MSGVADFLRTAVALAWAKIVMPLATPPGLDPHRTALVLIDLQRGIIARPAEPRSAAEVVATCSRLAEGLRPRGVLVVRVRVTFDASNGPSTHMTDVDQPNPAGTLPPGWDELVTDVRLDAADVVIDKHQWGAFYGTSLDLVLRRCGRDTIVLGGVSTNVGVESTARDAWERGYRLLLVEDAMATGMGAAAHAFAVTRIFPRLGRVCQAEDVLAALA